MPRWLWWLLGVIAVIFIFRDPGGSGNAVSQAIHAVGTFVGSIH
jgi:hypothetical protein